MITAWIRCRSALVAALLALMGAAPAWAHKASDAYLLLAGTPSATTLRVDVALRDLDVALDLDADGDGRLTWAEVRAAWPAIEDYLRSRVQVDGCDFPAAVRSLERRVDGVYAALSRNGTCRADASHAIRYTVLGDVDATHRGIARIELDGAPGVLRVLDPARPDAVGVPAAKAALPSFIEPAIAATIVLAAFDNVRPIFKGPRALVTFAFGLIHGFGFAGVLAELNLPAADFAWALLRFNLGLEIGQVAIVAVVTTLLFLLRGRARYPAWVIRGGSLAAMLIGLVWLIERTADVSLLPL